MALTRKTQATVPVTELARLREHLAPYGSTLWDPEGESVLVLRVPGNEPDLVNDMEEAAEYVGAELHEAKALLLLGNTGSTVVPPEILTPIVQLRRKRDQEFAKAVRPSMKPGTHRIMAAPGDAKRLPRLIVRLPRATVAATEDADWDNLACTMGMELSDPGAMSLEAALQGVRFVHVVADKDEVRLDADLVLPDLESRWSNEQERRRLAVEAAAKLAPPKPVIDASLPLTSASKTVTATSNDPLAAFDAAMAVKSTPTREDRAKMAIRRETAPSRTTSAAMGTYTSRRAMPLDWEASAEPSAAERQPFDIDAELDSFHRSRYESRPVEVDPRHRVVQQEVDDLVGAPVERPTARRASASTSRSATVGTGATVSPGTLRSIDDIIAGVGPVRPAARSASAPRASAATARSIPEPRAPITVAAPAPKPVKAEAPGIAELRAKMEINGYEFAPTGIEGIAFAAERAKHPMRVLAFGPAKLDLATAVKVLELVRAMDADVAYVVCAEADQDAKERFIATRGRWVAPDAVGQLVLA